VPRTRLALAAGLTVAQDARLAELVAARAGGAPLQHLTGVAPFRYGELAVGPGVFVPRPETELLVTWGLDALRVSRAAEGAPVVVDLCAGSGAIALAVAQEWPGARVYAVEQEPAAVEWLRRNAAGTTVSIVEGDAADAAVLSTLDGTVDLVLCNPPYLPVGVALPGDVAAYDPQAALYSGVDGLELVRRLVPRVAALLRPGGGFAVEHDDAGADGSGHAVAVPALLRADGRYGDIADHADLAGRARFATARRLADSTV